MARIARGKVNESLFSRHIESLGIQSAAQDKSYREHDAFDCVFNGRHGEVETDVKTFHVLTQFIELPREPFGFDALLSGVRHGTDEWHRFFPMLVPLDYKKHKDMYVFAVSVEDKLDRSAASSLEHPWLAFPEGDEYFLVDPKAIERREQSKVGLDVTLDWQQGMPGAGGAVYERDGDARLKPLVFQNASRASLTGLSSFLAIQLDDTAKNYLWKRQATLDLRAQETDGEAVASQFDAKRFREVFPRQGYALHLLGWIGREEFDRLAQLLPKGSPCYFYPGASSSSAHAPGTKTDNLYVLPGELHPIQSLTKV
ncbi:MAG: hypothetical protein ACYCSN_10125 [Acidobacteriaceae bacterium]